jgi:hypothetical protein
MTLDSWLFIFLGLIQTWTAVQGGIVSARTLPVGRERNIHIAMFVLLGAIGIGLITWQAVNVSHAERDAERQQQEAQRQQQELKGKIDATQLKLDKAQELLTASLLSQEHMKGQLDTLSMVAGKIGQNSSQDMKQLVAAISKVANAGHIGSLTNKQLCDRAKDWAKRARVFENESRQEDEAQHHRTIVAWANAKTDDEKKKISEQNALSTGQAFMQRELEFRNNYLAEAIYLRDEILKRLPAVPQPTHSQSRMFEGVAGPYGGIYDGADYMEKLALSLCPQ